ncbi:1,3(4)-beta-glucanase [Besnoitia besnoiti]|uniref:1,3(4)-beta-glucanase n=1 Tax=Besnoitia besnoiti TaxID=94643 RepID=A0A2A9MEK6_BESBE|nr:1,3(4)-beta-glucanase [Besnoitia besnoiti]PFH34057.1 1,3(4)-beta-glucanase [Besnoitia besnoiti]
METHSGRLPSLAISSGRGDAVLKHAQKMAKGPPLLLFFSLLFLGIVDTSRPSFSDGLRVVAAAPPPNSTGSAATEGPSSTPNSSDEAEEESGERPKLEETEQQPRHAREDNEEGRPRPEEPGQQMQRPDEDDAKGGEQIDGSGDNRHEKKGCRLLSAAGASAGEGGAEPADCEGPAASNNERDRKTEQEPQATPRRLAAEATTRSRSQRRPLPAAVSSRFVSFPPQRRKTPELYTEHGCRDTWYKARTYEGWEILDESKFWFFSYDDPTGGYVNYVPREEAIQKGLVAVTADGRTVLKVDAWNSVGASSRGRDSVRLSAVEGFDDALWVVSLNHAPEGCGTWPALWTTGADPWPASGEIDLYEGVNLNRKNRVSLHTSQGCNMWGIDETNFAGTWAYSGDGVEARDCYVHATPYNTGCSIEPIEDAFGEAFNEKGGGVYVLELKRDRHVRAWYFTHQEVPTDLRVGSPDPDRWAEKEKLPIAAFPLTNRNCPGPKHLWGHRLIINTTFCGGWAGNLFSRAGGCPGEGMDACRAFVRDNPSQFKNAFWEFNYIHVYLPGAPTCVTTTTTTTTFPVSTGWPVYPPPQTSTSTSTLPPTVSPSPWPPLTDSQWWQGLYYSLALLAGHSESTQPPCLEADVDYLGHDLHKYEEFIYTAEQCRLLCLHTTGCFYFSFVQSSASCYLKDIQALLNRRTGQMGIVSGQKRCQ